MELSQWVVYTAAEALFVLVIACLLLLLHTKGLKQLIQSLQSKLAKAKRELKTAKQQEQDSAATTDKGEPYALQLAEQIQATENFHASQAPSIAIAQDLNPDTPPARHIAAMRHRFLRAEQDSLDRDSGETDWSKLAEHYDQLKSLQAKAQAPQPPIAVNNLSYDEQRAEIERFKRLFTTMETQWQSAKEKAENYYAQLLKFIGNSTEPEHLALKTLAEEQLAHIDLVLPNATLTIAAPTTALVANQDLDHLKTINAQQKDQIAELQQRLANASDEDRLELSRDLERQLAQQLQFMKESEVCIDLLEKELKEASQRISQLELRTNEQNGNEQVNQKQKLNQKIQQLENENEQLVNLAEHSNTEQQRKIARKDKEIQSIKVRFAELARRYKAISEKVK